MMKKLYKIVTFLSFVLLAACSSDDHNGLIETPRYVKKMTSYQYDGAPEVMGSIETVYQYENNILVGAVSSAPNQPDFLKQKFHYDGNKITAIEGFENGAASPVLTITFGYEGNLLKTTYNNITKEKTVYGYHNGILSDRSVYVPELNGTVSNILSSRIHYTFGAGNVTVEKIELGISGGQQLAYENVYAYDAQANPFKFMNPYLMMTYYADGFHPLSNNNIIGVTTKYTDSADTTPYIFEIIYDEQHYPVQIKKYYQASHALINQTDFEYLN